MKLSALFFKTFKNPPQEADVISHKLLEQAGFISRLSKGCYTYTPLMWRVLTKLKAIIREELNRVGCLEIQIPELHPKEIWEKTGRWNEYTAANVLYTVTDREQNPHCLAATHEEAATLFVSSWVDSYKQLPVNVYQISNKYRDEIRTRFGLMRAKVFIMKDGYAFCKDEEQIDQMYDAMRKAYSAILDKLELSYVIVQADAGKIGKGRSEEFQLQADIGEDLLLTCDDIAFNVEKAEATIPPYHYDNEEKSIKCVDTPNTQTIEELAAFLKVDKPLILKTIVYKLTYSDGDKFIAIGIRGDRDINEAKVATFFAPLDMQLASKEEVESVLGATFGFIGPLNLSIPFYADASTKAMKNFVCANGTKDKHCLNVNFRRDIVVDTFYDFLLAQEGDGCPFVEGGKYTAKRGIEVGHIFHLGTKYSETLGAYFQDENGSMKPLIMGSYGIGVGRLAQGCIEQKHDDRGMIWPKAIAPFLVSILPVNVKDIAQMKAAESIYNQLLACGIDTCLDDREERLGFKLKDSDLIGIPYKIIIGKRFIEDKALEIESRTGDKTSLPLSELTQWARSIK